MKSEDSEKQTTRKSTHRTLLPNVSDRHYTELQPCSYNTLPFLVLEVKGSNLSRDFSYVD
jgi:hypothetical protein